MGCTKDTTPVVKVYPTIEPLSYFPAYPGSYWEYNDSLLLEVSDNYVQYVYNKGVHESYHKDTLMLPELKTIGIFNGNGKRSYVKEYEISRPNYDPSSWQNGPFQPILSPNLGEEFYVKYYTGSGVYYKGRNVKMDTSINVAGTTYTNVTIQRFYSSQYPVTPTVQNYFCATKRDFYAKDVGLIRRDVKLAQDTVFITTYKLTDYFINH